jgi:sulfide:quinone oxidoreductase
MGTQTVILGGGFGGIATATALRERLPGGEHRIVLVDRRDSFFMGLRKLWVLVGSATLDECRHRLAELTYRGIEVQRAEILSIDPATRTVQSDAGLLRADHLVVALGAEPRPDLLPGAAPTAFNLYDAESVALAAARVAELRAGRILVAVTGLPYRCPPAPYEAIMLLDDLLRRRGVRDRVELGFVTVQPMLLPNAGPAGARWVGEQLERRGIAYEVGRTPTSLDAGRLIFEDGELAFDIALLAPPHRPPRVVAESELAGPGGWAAVDPATLETRFPGVFAIGDVTDIPLANQTALPKAGLFAEAHGTRVADAIAASVTNAPAPPPFDGRGACFLEMGGGQATLVQGDFFARPAPDVRVGEPSPESLAGKHRFESERLARWFGDG